MEAEIQAFSDLGERLLDSILAKEPLEAIIDLIKSDAPLWYQNLEEGMSPLHAAAYVQNTELVKLLIEKGAIWNAVDNFKNSAGDIALSLNDSETYTLIRDAGIRAELLFSLLSSNASVENPSSLILKEIDHTAAASAAAFLSSKLTFSKDSHDQDVCILQLDGDEIGVMMGWERGIMERTVRLLCQGHPHAHDLRVLNIGFGLGIIDSFFQSLPILPTEHVIIEPHPDVLQHMRGRGWYKKPGVNILEGKWQDFINNDNVDLGKFDVIYIDTFSEDYSDLRQFFGHLGHLFRGPDSRFSFFNGLGATFPTFYDVYTHITELHLAEMGVDVEWYDVDVTFNAEEGRWGNTRQYFTLPIYRLPISRMRAGTIILYIYDRHCFCIYYQDWHRTRRPKPAAEGGILPAVSQAVAPVNTAKVSGHISGFTSPRDALSSGTGVVVAVNDIPAQSSAPPTALSSTGLAFDEEAKLVYGVVLSLRNMIKKLSGRDEQFVQYRTSTYKLHLYETLSGYKLIMFTDPHTDTVRFVLRQIYTGPFLEYVVRNPLVKMDSRDFGIDNEYFRASIDRLVRGLPVFS